MKSLRTLFAAVLMAASLIGGPANASLIGDKITATAFVPDDTNPLPADWAIDQASPMTIVDPDVEFTSVGGLFAAFDFSEDTLTISIDLLIDNWLDWPTYTFSGFQSEIISFDLIDSAGILAGSDILSATAHGFTPSSVTVYFGDGELDPDSNAPSAYVLFSIGTRQHVPEPQTIFLVLAALGLMGLSMRHGRALPR